MDLADLTEQVRQFAVEREWLPFHTPKNLVMALSVEAGELTELFQWLTPEESAAPDARLHVRAGEEMADVLAYLLMLADALDLDLDLADAFAHKMAANQEKYPVHLARGSAAKYDELREPGSGDADPGHVGNSTSPAIDEER